MIFSKTFSYLRLILSLVIIPVLLYACPPDSASPEKIYYAIEINGVVCGYSESSDVLIKRDGKDVIEQDNTVFIMLSLLGSEFNTELKTKAFNDPETRRSIYEEIKIKQGTAEYNIEMSVLENKAVIKSTMSKEPKEIEITPNIILGSDEIFTRLKKDVYVDGLTEVNYDILAVMEGEVQNSTFRKTGEEVLELAGKKFNTLIIEQVNHKTGMKTTNWLAPDFDYFVQFEVMNRKIYLSDQNVPDKIKVADMDENIFTKTNVQISDIQAITYMKVDAVIEPTGSSLKSEDLNVPGQKFTGTVIENHIEGIFEINYKKYDGRNAPPFPPEFDDPELAGYLTTGDRVESDDPVLIKKAEEITAGSKDSWEAAVRLSKWVAENIHYAIPGGGTPRRTYDTRSGECGAHSFLLATFCRTVGIPARVVWGAIYTPNYGGGFGQHAWNEIYMGEAGWIPVDATAFEIDYVDAGHIRISEYQSSSSAFNGKKFEVLDYKLSASDTEAAAIGYSEYFGKYTNKESGNTFEVLEKEGNLSVNIPGRMVLPFKEPDERGRWYCKLSPTLYLEFGRREDGTIDYFQLHEMVTMTRKSSPEEIPAEVPDTLKHYLGNYFFAQANLEFKVLYEDDMLAIFDPGEKKVIKLQMPDEEGGWKDEKNKNTVYFDKDDQGNISSLRIDAANKFVKGEPASEEE